MHCITRHLNRIAAIGAGLVFSAALAASAPTHAHAMSLMMDCSAALAGLQDNLETGNSCTGNADCTVVARPPCGCEDLAVNDDSAEHARQAMHICTDEGVICAPCYFDPDAKPPVARCVANHCKLIK